MKTLSGPSRAVRDAIRSLRETTPYDRPIPGDPAGQIRALMASKKFDHVRLEELTDAQIELACFLALQFGLRSVRQFAFKHKHQTGVRSEQALELIITVRERCTATVTVLPCGELAPTELRVH